jgi:hypothetical protein
MGNGVVVCDWQSGRQATVSGLGNGVQAAVNIRFVFVLAGALISRYPRCSVFPLRTFYPGVLSSQRKQGSMQTPFKYVLALFVVPLLVAGCSGSAAQNPTDTATSRDSALTEATAPAVASATPTAAPEVSPTATDPLQAIANSVHSFGAITSYRLTVVIEGGTPNENSTIKIEVAGKEYHFVSSRGVEFYLIGNTFYLKQGAKAQWRKLPSNSVEATSVTAALLAAKESVTSAIAAHNASLSGADIIDGKPMLVYQYTLNGAPAKLWVGAADGLPYKNEGISKTGSKTTLTISDYNAQIVLTPPIP